MTRRQEEELSRVTFQDPALTYRPKDETADEKKARKQSVKEERRVCFSIVNAIPY